MMTKNGPQQGRALSRNWSVLIPYYNEAGFLPRTLSSLLNQQLAPARLILVDNGSTDGSATLARQVMAGVDDIETLYLDEPRPGKIHALQTGLAAVESKFVALCDADTCYPPHYLYQANRLFARSEPDVVAVIAADIYHDPQSWRGWLQRAKIIGASRLLTKQAHAGSCGHNLRTEAARRAGGFSTAYWPYVLEDHEIMHRLFRVGRARYHLDLWCMPSPRRSNAAATSWTLAERLLYNLTCYSLKDWYFYRFLKTRLEKRNLTGLKLRERTWQ
jgi:glycosyltransferase involved in cell wall biosynthesis